MTQEQRKLRRQWGKISQGIRHTIFEEQDYTCQKCGYNAEEHGRGYLQLGNKNLLFFPRLELDHIIPLTMGGTNDPENIQTLCNRCNASKGQRIGNDSWTWSKKVRRNLVMLGILEK